MAAAIALGPLLVAAPVASAAPCGDQSLGNHSWDNQACLDCVHQHEGDGVRSCANSADSNSSPPYIPPAQIPASCQPYVGPDANGNDQNGVLQLCIKTHQLTGN
jgi:hypothetical protein